MKIDIKLAIIIALAIALFFSVDGCSRISNLFDHEEVISETKETKIDTTVTKKKDKVTFDQPSVFVPESVKIEIKEDKVKEVPKKTPVVKTPEKEVKAANKYETVNELSNGTIKSTIITTGELLSTDFELTTNDTVYTKETVITKKVVQSGLFGELNSTLGLDGRVKDIGAVVNYYHKGKWSIGAGPQYDVDPKINIPAQDRLGVTLKIGFKF